MEFQDTPDTPLPEWFKALDKRQQNEVVLARLYSTEFGHGTDGHNRLILIAKMADMLDQAEGALADALSGETQEQPDA